MRITVYFDSILNEQWLFSYRNNDINCTPVSGHAPQQENLEKICNLQCVSWCILSSDFALQFF